MWSQNVSLETICISYFFPMSTKFSTVYGYYYRATVAVSSCHNLIWAPKMANPWISAPMICNWLMEHAQHLIWDFAGSCPYQHIKDAFWSLCSKATCILTCCAGPRSGSEDCGQDASVAVAAEMVWELTGTFLYSRNSLLPGDQRSDGAWTVGKKEIQNSPISIPGRHSKISKKARLISKPKQSKIKLIAGNHNGKKKQNNPARKKIMSQAYFLQISG